MSSATPKVTQSAFIEAAMDPASAVPVGITDGHGAPTTKRFNVYRNNVVVGLRDALSVGFPAIRSLVGDTFFDAMAAEYARSEPPSSPIMPAYGAGFSAFLENFPPAASLPYLADVARLEYTMRMAYHAADAAPVATDTLKDPSVFLKRVTLAPAVHVVASPYPIDDIRRAALGGPQPTGTAQDVLITRPDFDPVMTPFAAGTAAVINALRDGASLAEAIELAPDTLDLTAFISALVSGGAITSLEDAP